MDSIQVGCVATVLILQHVFIKKRRAKRRWWSHPILSHSLVTGQFHVMFNTHRMYPDKFYQFYRMSVESFDELLGLIGEFIGKRDSVMRRAIDPAERLALTLRYLASGMTFVDLEFDFHISRKTTRLIVKEVCVVILNVLQPTEMPTPDKAMWLEKAVAFEKITNFPNCIGCVDGKHIRIRCPLQTGSQHYNFKHFFSIVLMAVCDANYYFTAIDVGAYGREGDPTIFNKSNFGQRLKSGQLDIPPPTPLRAADGSEVGQPVPYVLLGDEAFGLSRNLMRPYPSKGLTKQKRVYNYRHCRGRRVVECSFGILSNKWRVLHSAMLVAPDYATVIVQACCVLHNFVRKRDGFIFEDTLTCDLDDMEGVAAVGGQNKGIDIREMFCRFFNNEGAVPWQDARV